MTFGKPWPVRIACDSLVALGNSTVDGKVLFAKNSDRPAMECQPLTQIQRCRHQAGELLRCTYISIPQATETARLIGSRPYWCWGFEHGLNEHGVAVGNHSVFTKEPLAGQGLIGMDLVRLGLERARSAEQALETITALLAQYGQGGSGYADKDWAYHNSFLVADGTRAFVLETSGRHWAMRHVDDVASVSNHLTIGADWESLSDGTIEDAIASGWWSERRDDRFDFAAAYRDTSMAPEVISSGRHRRTCELLATGKGKLSEASLRTGLRDHYGRPTPLGEATPAEAEYFGVCMHADPVGTTTASMIAKLPHASGEPLLYWAGLGSPCVGAFVPLFVDCDVPQALTLGGAAASRDSAWWRCKKLLLAIEADWPRHASAARAAFDRFEAETAERLAAHRILEQSAPERRAFAHERVETMLALVDELSGLCT
ncbi:MAG: C69 family dipeptidase [Deltaproteobacteria bacterium]|nr:C69 family dipeptidase [Deltaproteobacteria bacterium]